ncbi:hypothetical protein FB446DRAFT_768933 [Lentinula raphanica]|nr:hypothetical protein FB446DRAFT_768933 [Lentinula raphanica]
MHFELTTEGSDGHDTALRVHYFSWRQYITGVESSSLFEGNVCRDCLRRTAAPRFKDARTAKGLSGIRLYAFIITTYLDWGKNGRKDPHCNTYSLGLSDKRVCSVLMEATPQYADSPGDESYSGLNSKGELGKRRDMFYSHHGEISYQPSPAPKKKIWLKTLTVYLCIHTASYSAQVTQSKDANQCIYEERLKFPVAAGREACWQEMYGCQSRWYTGTYQPHHWEQWQVPNPIEFIRFDNPEEVALNSSLLLPANDRQMTHSAYIVPDTWLSRVASSKTVG